MLSIYTPCLKNTCFYFYANFGKCGPIFIFFSLLIQKRSVEEDGIITSTSPQIYCHTTLRNVNGQLYSFTVQLI